MFSLCAFIRDETFDEMSQAQRSEKSGNVVWYFIISEYIFGCINLNIILTKTKLSNTSNLGRSCI